MIRRKAFRRNLDHELLTTIYHLQWEWRQLKQMIENSIEPSEQSIYQKKITKAKYMFLLREARHLNIHAIKER